MEERNKEKNAPRKTDYTACHPGRTTTYILHVVPITRHTHDRRKSIGKKKQRKERKIKKRREKTRKRKNEKGKDKKIKDEKRKDKKSKKRQEDKNRKQGEGRRKKISYYSAAVSSRCCVMFLFTSMNALFFCLAYRIQRSSPRRFSS